MSRIEPPLHPAFIAALEADREQINQRFKLTSLEGSPLDGHAFQLHLAARVEPIVAAVHDVLPERTRTVTLTLVNISLQLFRSGFWSDKSRIPLLDQLWMKVLPKLAKFVARDPERVAGSFSNALINLAQQHPQVAPPWLNRIENIGCECSTVAELMDVGRVSAWREGRADMRSIALELLPRLPKKLTCKVLGIDSSTSDEVLTQLFDRLHGNHWLDLPSATEDGSAQPNTVSKSADVSPVPRIVKRVGAFTGFGGQFQSPPTVSLASGQFYVSDSHSQWRLTADCFGAVLERVPPDAKLQQPAGSMPSKKSTAKNKAEPNVSASGELTWGSHSKQLLQLAWPTSQAFDGQTLAVTLANSFHIVLIAPLRP